jgi:hypothetical protein
LDADEALTPNFAQVAREHLAKLEPGDRLSLRWITLWKNERQERTDGVFKNLYKDFAFCDDNTSHHQYAFLGVGRVPKSATGTMHTVSNELGGILHFQYATWEKTQLKQAWYRCSELIKGGKSARRINNTYSLSLDGKHVQTEQLPLGWTILTVNKSHTLLKGSWHMEILQNWFKDYGLLFFEQLQIWHIPELHDIFVKEVGREPKIKVFPAFIVMINELKNKVKNYVLS